VLVTNYQGKYLNGPNDVWVAPNGAMFITDPFTSAPVGSHDDGADEPGGLLSFARPEKFVMVTDDLKQPNGITGTPDGKNLFVSDIAPARRGATTSSPTARCRTKPSSARSARMA